MIDAPVYIDIMLAVVMGVCAGFQYVWLSFHGHSIGRWMQAIGWTGLCIRITWAVSSGENPPIASVSIPLLILAAGGASLTAYQQLRRLQANVRCMADPKFTCAREDRIKIALVGRKKK